MTVETSCSAALRAGLVTLTPRERELFDRLHAALGQWLDRRREVIEPTFGDYYSSQTPKVHLHRLRHKLIGTTWSIETGPPGTRAIRLIGPS